MLLNKQPETELKIFGMMIVIVQLGFWF